MSLLRRCVCVCAVCVLCVCAVCVLCVCAVCVRVHHRVSFAAANTPLRQGRRALGGARRGNAHDAG